MRRIPRRAANSAPSRSKLNQFHRLASSKNVIERDELNGLLLVMRRQPAPVLPVLRRDVDTSEIVPCPVPSESACRCTEIFWYPLSQMLAVVVAVADVGSNVLTRPDDPTW